jgi:hypothetical protein
MYEYYSCIFLWTETLYIHCTSCHEQRGVHQQLPRVPTDDTLQEPGAGDNYVYICSQKGMKSVPTAL